MSTKAQINANQQNAQKSTGPRTVEGKAVVSQNAVKHGLFAAEAVINGENPADYELYHDQMLAELAPVGMVESMLAARFVSSGNSSIRLGRNPYGPTDKEVLVMKLAKPDGTVVASLFDYATHATCLGGRNLTISGDVLGLAEQFVEKILGEQVIAPAFAGASGNIDPWFRVLPGFNTEPGWIPEPVLLGTLLGEEVVHVYRDIENLSAGGDI